MSEENSRKIEVSAKLTNANRRRIMVGLPKTITIKAAAKALEPEKVNCEVI